MKKLLFALLPLIIVFASCKEDVDQRAEDRDTILKYIADNNLNAQSTASGLYYVIENEGSGKRPTVTSDVQVYYKGYFVNGGLFDESIPQGVWFNLSQVIQGWQEGIPMFKEGGKGKLLVPSHLGYGPTSRGDIPGNSVLIFDIILKDVR